MDVQDKQDISGGEKSLSYPGNPVHPCSNLISVETARNYFLFPITLMTYHPAS